MCYYKVKDDWNENNKCFGMCAIISLIINDYFDGDICKIHVYGISHYFNLIDNKVVDLTSSQFDHEIEISVDEYPFGIDLEIENKSSHKEPKEVVRKWVKNLRLDINKAYRLSWDDKYSELCKSQNVKQYNHVTFDKPMPKVIE